MGLPLLLQTPLLSFVKRTLRAMTMVTIWACSGRFPLEDWEEIDLVVSMSPPRFSRAPAFDQVAPDILHLP